MQSSEIRRGWLNDRAETYVIESQRYECECRPPDTNELRDIFTSREAEEAGKTNKPVGADGSDEDLMPHWSNLLRRCKGDSLFLEVSTCECSSVATDDGYGEQGAGEVAKEGEGPVGQHLGDTETALQDSNCCELGI